MNEVQEEQDSPQVHYWHVKTLYEQQNARLKQLKEEYNRQRAIVDFLYDELAKARAHMLQSE